MDPARRKRVLKLLDGRDTDREQAIELLAALDDADLWREALTRVRTQTIAGTPSLYHADLALLAAAPEDLPEARAIRARTVTSYFSTTVPDAAACLDHLREVHVTAAWGGDRPNLVPGLALLTGPVDRLDLIGVDLSDGAALARFPLVHLSAVNCTWTAVPALPRLETLTGYLRDDTTTLGPRLPALRRLELRARGLSDLGAVASARQLEEVVLQDTKLGADQLAAVPVAALRKLHLRGGLSFDPGPLAGAAALQDLDLQDLDVVDLRPLSGLTNLRDLALRGTSIRDLGPLGSVRSLRRLDLRKATSVTDLSPLRALPELRVLALGGSGVLPGSEPPELAPYCTWADDPDLALLADRPRRGAT